MNRRDFLSGSGRFIAAVAGSGRFKAAVNRVDKGRAVPIFVDAERALGLVPSNFIGLGFEISSVARPGLLSAQNRVYVQLVRTLGTHGVIRIGGNTSDYASFAADAQAVSAPKSTVINEANLADLGTFLDATGWKLIWGLKLGGGTERDAVEEAQAVFAATRQKLVAFEIGNEPDLFGRGTKHREKDYSYENYLKEYRRYKAAVRAKLPDAPFAGPDAADATDWVTRFAADEGNDLKLLTQHYYRECANPGSTLEKLLLTDPKLAPELQKLRAASAFSHVPYRICETNSFCGGGKPGVSDTFGSALWVLDFMFTLACAGCAGVNIETGVNQLGFISSYSPIGDDEHGTYRAEPEYYGMLAFAQGSQGLRVAVDYDAVGLNLSAYAILRDRKQLSVTLINRDKAYDAAVSISTRQNFARANVLRLAGPSLESKNGTTLGGSAITANGEWTPGLVERLRTTSRGCEFRVPAGSAAIVKLEA